MKLLYLLLTSFLIAEPAYVGSVSEQKIHDRQITSEECLEIMEMGNFMPKDNEDFYRIIYKGHLYVVTVKYMGSIKHYSCDIKIKLMKN
jgi:hypothetical protein